MSQQPKNQPDDRAPVPAADSVLEGISLDRLETPRRRFLRRFLAQRLGVIALLVVLAFIVVAIVAPYISPHDPYAVGLGLPLAPPSTEFLLGLDDIGRDIFSRTLIGIRISIIAAGTAISIAVAIGVPVGLLSGFLGGWVDAISMRVTDALMAIPALVLAIAIVAILGPGITNAMIAIGLVFSPRITRVARATAMGVTQEPFVEAAVAAGASKARIIVKHVLPNILSSLFVQISLTAALAVLAEAALSFLGLGTQPPQASLGAMVSRAFGYIRSTPTYPVFPALMIMVLVLSLNLFGDAVRDSLGREVPGSK